MRDLAAVLGISYRRLDSGRYNHSAVITMLDPDGRVSERIEWLRQDNDALVAPLGR